MSMAPGDVLNVGDGDDVRAASGSKNLSRDNIMRGRSIVLT